MRLREPYVRKHICTYEQSDATGGNNCIYTERTCRDCKKVQWARMTPDEFHNWPQDVRLYFDLEWKDGEIPDEP